MLAAGTFDMAGMADILSFYCEFSWAARGAGRTGRDVTHDATLYSCQLCADGSVHMLHFGQIQMTAAGKTAGGKARGR